MRRESFAKCSPLQGLVASLVLWLLPWTGQSQNRSFITRDAHPYFRFDAGPVFTEDGHLTEFGSFPDGNRVTYDAGFTMDAAAGYAFNKWVAAELELGWTFNEIGRVEGINLDDTSFSTIPILANVVLQWPIPRTLLVPYVGAGVGGAATIFDTDYFSNGAVTLVGSESDFVFAWQGFAGLRLELNDNMMLSLGYKYLSTEDSSYKYESLSGGPDFKLGFDGVHSHAVTFSFSMKF